MGNIWLSATGPLGLGDGSSAANASDASTAAKLQAIWVANFNLGTVGNPIVYNYLSGTFQTNGQASGFTNSAFDNQYHLGAGQGSTILQLTGSTGAGLNTIFGTNQGRINWQCQHMTLDCNATAQPNWTNQTAFIGAIGFGGGRNILINDVEIKGFGTPKAGFECFPVYIAPPGSAPYANQAMTSIAITNCKFDNPVSGNLDGLTCIGIFDDNTQGVIADDSCEVNGCTFNCASDFLYAQCVSAPSFVGNTVTNMGVGWYLEPSVPSLGRFAYSGSTIRILNNVVNNTNKLAFALFHNSGGIGDMIVRGNIYQARSGAISQGFQLSGAPANPPGVTGQVIISENIFYANNSSGNQNAILIQDATPDIIPKSVDIYSNRFVQFGYGHEIILDKSINAYTYNNISH